MSGAATTARASRPAPTPADAGAGAPTLTIVIVNWNTKALLRACLRSIFERAGALAAEIIVVDNASHDGTPEMVRAEFPRVRLIANDANRGFAAANNQALRVAAGRYVLLLNPDTVVLDDVLARSLRYADAHPDVAVLGCQVMQSDTEVQRTCFRFPSPLGTLLFALGLTGCCRDSPIAGRDAYGGWNRDTERDVEVVSGMFMLVRREAIDAVGPMDEDYFVYAEEADWCRRFHTAGWRCVFAPVGRILHVDGGGRSTDQVSVRMYVQLQKSLLTYHRKHWGRLGHAAAKTLFIASMIARAAWWGARSVSAGATAARRRRDQSMAALRFHLTGAAPPASLTT